MNKAETETRLRVLERTVRLLVRKLDRTEIDHLIASLEEQSMGDPAAEFFVEEMRLDHAGGSGTAEEWIGRAEERQKRKREIFGPDAS